jgi:plasmid replication initiation protein
MKKIKATKKNRMTLIKKSNDLIEARYMFDLWETRFFLAILSQIHKDDKELHVYRIRFKDVIKTFDLKSNSSYDLLREAAKSIMDRKVAVAYEKDGTTREILYHIIRKVDYLKEDKDLKAGEKHEYIDVVVEEEMKPFLLELQRNFTAYDLRNVVQLGVYPIRIYELLKQYENIGKRTLKIEEIKKMFELTSQYPRFSNFYQKIIQPAIKEINEHTDLKIIDVVKLKEDRNVVALQFFFKKKEEEELRVLHKDTETTKKKTAVNLFSEFSEKEDRVGEEQVSFEEIEELQNESDNLFNKYQNIVLTSFGVSASVFLKSLENKTEEDILRAVRITEQAKKANEVKNLAGFFIEAFRQGFTNEKEEKRLAAAKKAAQITQTERLKVERAQAINEKIRTITANNPEITLQAISLVKQSKAGKFRLKTMKIETPDIEHFRTDAVLRDFVKECIMELYANEFKEIFVRYDTFLK